MLNFIRRLILGPPEPKSVLSAEQVRAIAENAVVGSHWEGRMHMPMRKRSDDGTLLWIVWPGNRGSSIEVIIDDATGEVIRCQEWHTR